MSEKKLLCDVHTEAEKRIGEIEDQVEIYSLIYKYCRMSESEYSTIIWDEIRPIILFSLYHIELLRGKQLDYSKFKLDELFENGYRNYMSGNKKIGVIDLESLMMTTFEKYSV